MKNEQNLDADREKGTVAWTDSIRVG